MNYGEQMKTMLAELSGNVDTDLWIDNFFSPLKEKLLEIGGSEESVMGFFATELIEREFMANHFAYMFINYGIDFQFYDFALMGYNDFFNKPEAAKVLQEAIDLAILHKKEIEAIRKSDKKQIEKSIEFEKKGIFKELDKKADEVMFIHNEERIEYVKKYMKDFVDLANEKP